VDIIFERTQILKNFPEAGRVVPEFNNPNIRELTEGNYRIIYEIISSEVVEILTVQHSSRKLK
jgi:toxin ParE1/3/4